MPVCLLSFLYICWSFSFLLICQASLSIRQSVRRQLREYASSQRRNDPEMAASEVCFIVCLSDYFSSVAVTKIKIEPMADQTMAIDVFGYDEDDNEPESKQVVPPLDGMR